MFVAENKKTRDPTRINILAYKTENLIFFESNEQSGRGQSGGLSCTHWQGKQLST